MGDTDKAKLLMVLLGKKKAAMGADKPDPEAGADSKAEGLRAAMHDLLDAVKSNDVEAMAAAFGDAVDIHCQDEPRATSDDDEDDDDKDKDEDSLKAE